MARRLPLRDVLVLVLFAAVFLGGLSVLTSGLKAPGEVSRQVRKCSAAWVWKQG